MVSSHVKKVTETDIYLFAALSQDFAPMHLDESWAATTVAGGRIAHGVFTLALMAQLGGPSRSGYSRVRFTKPVRFGDVVTVTAEGTDGAFVTGHRAIEARNQDNEVVGVAVTAMKRNDEAAKAPTSPLADYPDVAWISRTIAACDVALFDFVTKDDTSLLSALSDDESHAGTGEIAPPELSVALMSGASTAWEEHRGPEAWLSYGYDDVVFNAPLRIGESIRVGYATESELPEQHKLIARTEAISESGRVIASARHILWREA